MSEIIGVSGPSGNGKSTSFRNLDWDKTFIIKPNGKSLPFKSSHLKEWDPDKKEGHYIETTDYDFIKVILKALPEYGKKVIIIDDSTHLLLKYNMDRALETGYAKFMEAALAYYNMLQVAQSLPSDVRVYLVTHIDEDQNGNEIVKIPGGKMITEKIDVPSFMTVSLRAMKTQDGYKFRTQSSGRDFYKTPLGLFEEEYIDNDLKIVDDAICEYNGFEK